MQYPFIKVCGMTAPDNIRAVEALGVDMIGMVFYPQSPRFVPMIRARAGIIPDYSAERLAHLAPQAGDAPTAASEREGKIARRVGVFVDDMPQNIITRVYNFGLDYVQLHGDEPRETCENLRRTLDPDIRPGIGIIKAISISKPEDLDRCEAYEGAVDMFLFDTRCTEVGGSGRQFDWSMLDRYRGDTPFLLSGGIGPEDAARLQAFHHPRCVGVDLNSRFETQPGIKDVALLQSFIKTLRP